MTGQIYCQKSIHLAPGPSFPPGKMVKLWLVSLNTKSSHEPLSFYNFTFICSLFPQIFEWLHTVVLLYTHLSMIVLRWISLFSFGLQQIYLKHQSCPQGMSVVPWTNLQGWMLSIHKSIEGKSVKEKSIKGYLNTGENPMILMQLG